MPAPRHLGAFDDVLIPEPPTLFTKHEGQASPSRFQELEIDRHMDLNYDLFVDLTPEFDQPASQKNPGQIRLDEHEADVSRAASRPGATTTARSTKPSMRANLSGEALVRWKHQRYLRNYLSCIKGVDESVATLMKTLEELDLDENTIVIYSADQGFYLGDRGWYDKRWMYEPSLEMPLIVKWPGVVKPGSRKPRPRPESRLRLDLPRHRRCENSRRSSGAFPRSLAEGRTSHRLARCDLLPLLRVSQRPHGGAAPRRAHRSLQADPFLPV
jgi:hypothetical protein